MTSPPAIQSLLDLSNSRKQDLDNVKKIIQNFTSFIQTNSECSSRNFAAFSALVKIFKNISTDSTLYNSAETVLGTIGTLVLKLSTNQGLWPSFKVFHLPRVYKTFSIQFQNPITGCIRNFTPAAASLPSRDHNLQIVAYGVTPKHPATENPEPATEFLLPSCIVHQESQFLPSSLDPYILLSQTVPTDAECMSLSSVSIPLEFGISYCATGYSFLFPLLDS